ncbi:MAG: NUDIX domain-containing protein [Candidatus Omnitrophota bacterium]
MNKEFSAGAIVFKREGDVISFLIIYSRRNRLWGFPKGHLEQGESREQAALREIKEETGLRNLEFINGFKEEVMYETVSKRPPFKGQKIEKYVIYFLCEIKNQDIIVDGREITDYRFLPISEAEGLVKFRNLNKVLRRAHDFLQAV